jgi:hypothetical protein
MSAARDPSPVEHVELPLRERIPEYLAVFGVGLGVAALIGALIGALSAASMVDAVGYTIVMLGVVFLLAGGAGGGGYTNMSMGAIGSLFGGRGRIDENVDDAEARRGGRPNMDPRERLRRGLRPEANPRAFWQVIGGFAYIAIGVAVVELFG